MRKFAADVLQIGLTRVVEVCDRTIIGKTFPPYDCLKWNLVFQTGFSQAWRNLESPYTNSILTLRQGKSLEFMKSQ